MLLNDFLDRQAACIMGGLGVVGDSEILIPPFPAGPRHHFKRVHAIGEVGMRMQDAAHVAICRRGAAGSP